MRRKSIDSQYIKNFLSRKIKIYSKHYLYSSMINYVLFKTIGLSLAHFVLSAALTEVMSC